MEKSEEEFLISRRKLLRVNAFAGAEAAGLAGIAQAFVLGTNDRIRVGILGSGERKVLGPYFCQSNSQATGDLSLTDWQCPDTITAVYECPRKFTVTFTGTICPGIDDGGIAFRVTNGALKVDSTRLAFYPRRRSGWQVVSNPSRKSWPNRCTMEQLIMFRIS